MDVHSQQPLDFPFNFQIPEELEAGEPAEVRGISRDQVKLLVSKVSNNHIAHTQFFRISGFLSPGDVLVINTSATIKASFEIEREGDDVIELHLCMKLPHNLWIVEVSEPGGFFTLTFPKVIAGETLNLPQGGSVKLLLPYIPDQRSANTELGSIRLWIATIETPIDLYDYLDKFGSPIRYSYVKQNWDNKYYQTVYANEPGSVEMPSAGRAFSHELITHLVAQGIQFAPLILHTGVASLRNDEPLYEEYYRVPIETAQMLNIARKNGKRIIAIGTTVLRALETVTDSQGNTHPGEGWTNLEITSEHKIKSIDGFLTGFHTAKSTHISILTAFAGYPHVYATYVEALKEKYFWHEFGDLHLILK